MISAVASLVIAPLHALARFATVAGRSDLESAPVAFWAVPAARALRPLLDFADPQTVYQTYGKFWFVAMAVIVLTALVTRFSRSRTAGKLEKWAWRIAITAYVLLMTGSFTSYWLLAVDRGFVLFTVPGLLLSLIGDVLLGIALLRAGFRPRLTSVLLVLDLPLSLVLSAVASQAVGSWPLMVAWAAAGWALWRQPTGRRDPAPVVSSSRDGIPVRHS